MTTTLIFFLGYFCINSNLDNDCWNCYSLLYHSKNWISPLDVSWYEIDRKLGCWRHASLNNQGIWSPIKDKSLSLATRLFRYYTTIASTRTMDWPKTGLLLNHNHHTWVCTADGERVAWVSTMCYNKILIQTSQVFCYLINSTPCGSRREQSYLGKFNLVCFAIPNT